MIEHASHGLVNHPRHQLGVVVQALGQRERAGCARMPQLHGHPIGVLDRRPRQLDQLAIQRFSQFFRLFL
jgi:hypothetical protein